MKSDKNPGVKIQLFPFYRGGYMGREWPSWDQNSPSDFRAKALSLYTACHPQPMLTERYARRDLNPHDHVVRKVLLPRFMLKKIEE